MNALFVSLFPTAEVEVLFSHSSHTSRGFTARESPCRSASAGGRKATLPAKEQLQLFESALRDPHRFGETLAKLKAFLGNDSVGVPARSNTHRPDSYLLADCFDTETKAVRPPPCEPPCGLSLRRYRPRSSQHSANEERAPSLNCNRRRRMASSTSVRVLIGFRGTGGIANAGSKRNGMWLWPRAACTDSPARRPSGKSKAAMKGENLTGRQTW